MREAATYAGFLGFWIVSAIISWRHGTVLLLPVEVGFVLFNLTKLWEVV